MIAFYQSNYLTSVEGGKEKQGCSQRICLNNSTKLNEGKPESRNGHGNTELSTSKSNTKSVNIKKEYEIPVDRYQIQGKRKRVSRLAQNEHKDQWTTTEDSKKLRKNDEPHDKFIHEAIREKLLKAKTRWNMKK